MREGIYTRGSGRGRRRQREWNSNQSLALPRCKAGHQNCGRVVGGLVMCLILWFVAWMQSMFWTPPISIESLIHQVPARAVVFELFQYYRHPQSHNMSFTALTPVHRRRLGHLDVFETSKCTRTEIERPFHAHAVDGNLSHQSRKKKGRNQGASSSTPRALGQLPLSGGRRVSERDVESFFVIVPLGYGENMKEYFLDIDTGSGITWVNCKGRGPMVLGPNGLLRPRPRSYLNCKVNPELCGNFQSARLAEKYPCDRSHKFKCLFEFEYGDNTAVKGSVILEEVNFKMSDGSRLQIDMAFGCVDQRVEDVTAADVDWKDHHSEDDDTDSNQDDEADDDGDEEQTSTDGLLGLGPHLASWVRQLNLLGIISEYVIAVCLEPVLGHISQGRRSSSVQVVGFISLGDSMHHTRQAAAAAWTAAIPPEVSTNEEADMYFAKLVGIKYREKIHLLQEPEPRRRGTFAVSGVQMGFDTGSSLTYLTRGTFDLVLNILDLDAARMGYMSWPHISEQMKCWQHKSGRKTSSLRDFGDLIMMFSALANDGTTSDLIIKPDYYITSMTTAGQLQRCFNIHLESEFEYGLLGAEAMRGHLLIFNEQHKRIGWSPVTSCKEI